MHIGEPLRGVSGILSGVHTMLDDHDGDRDDRSTGDASAGTAAAR